MKQPRPAPENSGSLKIKSLSDVRKALSRSYERLCEHPGSHDQARVVAVLMGRTIGTVTAAVAYHHLTKTAPNRKLDRFVRG